MHHARRSLRVPSGHPPLRNAPSSRGNMQARGFAAKCKQEGFAVICKRGGFAAIRKWEGFAAICKQDGLPHYASGRDLQKYASGRDCRNRQAGGICSNMQAGGICSNMQFTAMSSILTDIRKLLRKSNKQTSLESREFSAGLRMDVAFRIIRRKNKEKITFDRS